MMRTSGFRGDAYHVGLLSRVQWSLQTRSVGSRLHAPLCSACCAAHVVQRMLCRTYAVRERARCAAGSWEARTVPALAVRGILLPASSPDCLDARSPRLLRGPDIFFSRPLLFRDVGANISVSFIVPRPARPERCIVVESMRTALPRFLYLRVRCRPSVSLTSMVDCVSLSCITRVLLTLAYPRVAVSVCQSRHA